ADIACATVRYVRATDDTAFEQTIGLDLLVHTARLWRSLGHHDSNGRFRIDGVTGPDEYSAVADNNVYTNLMAQENLSAAADAATRHRDRATELGVDDAEMTSWREAAASMVIPYDQTLGVHPQADGVPCHEIWGCANPTAEQYPLLLPLPLLRPLPQTGGQTGGSGASHAAAPRRVHPGAEGPQLRLLRAAHGPRPLPVRMRASGHRGRDRSPRPGRGLPRRGRPDGPRRPRTQHHQRTAHGLAGRDLDRAGGRLRRDAGHRRCAPLHR